MKRLFKLAVFAALVALAVKIVMAKKEEWQGLSEPEVREKLGNTIGDRVPPEKLGEIQDKVVDKMRTHGVLREEDGSGEVGASVDGPSQESAG